MYGHKNETKTIVDKSPQNMSAVEMPNALIYVNYSIIYQKSVNIVHCALF